MAYLSWSEGFKSGGFNQRYNAAPPGNAPISFDPETAESFELGFKLDPTDYLRINIAAFTTDYDDIQMTYRLGVVPLLFNAGVASIDGGEIELEFAPTAEFRLDASLGYLDAKFDEITPPPPFGPVTPTATATLDSRLPFTPEFQGHLGLQYTFTLSSGWGLTPRADVSYTDSQFFDAGNSPEIAQLDAVTLVNASLAFEIGRREMALRAERQQPHGRVVSRGGNIFANYRFRLRRDHLCAATHLRADRQLSF